MSGDLIAILVFVMPGLVGAGTYRLLTVGRKLDQFDFTVFSFVLTVSSLLLAAFLQWLFTWSWGIDIRLLPIAELLTALNSTEIPRNGIYKIIVEYLFSLGFVVTNLLGLGLGLLLSIGINSGRIYEALQRSNLTQKSGRIDLWQDYFSQISPSEDCWVMVVFRDGRRYYGLLIGVSDYPDIRELILSDVIELKLNTETGESNEFMVSKGSIYIRGDVIEQIEIIQPASKTKV